MDVSRRSPLAYVRTLLSECNKAGRLSYWGGDDPAIDSIARVDDEYDPVDRQC